MPDSEGTDEADPNDVLATGALWGTLSRAQPPLPMLEISEYPQGNVLKVRFGFLKSTYRVTVTRIEDTEEA